MSASVSFDASQLSKLVKEYERRGGSVEVLTRQIAELLVSAVQGKFEAEGPGWPPLSPVTLARRREAASSKILTDTSNLAGSITRAWRGKEAEAYTEVPYAKYHVTGTTRRASGPVREGHDAPRAGFMPARDFTDLDWAPILEEIEQVLLLSVVPP